MSMTEASEMELIADTKLALRRLAASVTVISCSDQGERLAMSATAVSALSMRPPSMLACINQSATIHAVLTLGTPFCINILDVNQSEIAQLCGGGVSGDARFALGDWRLNEIGVPYLEGAQANIMCTTDATFAYGTHGIFIGKVQKIMVAKPVQPLLYVDGRYSRVAQA